MSSIPPPPPNMGPPPGYTPYGEGGGYAQPSQSGKATASMVLGIIGIFVCPIVLSVLAIVFGVQARNEINASGGRILGSSKATAGLTLGIIGLVLMPVWFIVLNSTN